MVAGRVLLELASSIALRMTTTQLKYARRKLPITELEQNAFCQTDKNLRTKTLEEEFKAGVRWQKIPARYVRMTPEEIHRGIAEARKAVGSRLVTLGHHYQREDVIQYADFRGDSYLLAKRAAQEKSAEFIIFCGVHFMAETADILTAPDQQVFLPNILAGCSMADMAQTEDVEDCWEDLTNLLSTTNTKSDRGKVPVVPLTYMNSTASIKGLCGRNGGLVCTSSNAASAMEWAFERGERILFIPDQHLGRNTGMKLGLSMEDMAVWNPARPLGGLSEERIEKVKLLLWKGHCSVHTRFTLKQVEDARRKYPDVTVIAHPECTRAVVDAADMNGSTEFIRKTVETAKPGTVWAIGTEVSMVNRLAKENNDKTVFCLDPIVCPCATMYRIHPAYLLWVLDGLQVGISINRVQVPEEDKRDSILALERMMEIGG